MPKKTYVQLNSIILAAESSSVTFSNIPQNYRDLVFSMNGQTGSNANVIYRINSDSGTNYSHVHMTGSTGASSGAGTFAEAYATYGSALSGTRFIVNLNILDYSTTDKHKISLVRNGYTNLSSVQMVEAQAIRWINTSAITTIVFSTNAGSFASGSTFTLYGIEA